MPGYSGRRRGSGPMFQQRHYIALADRLRSEVDENAGDMFALSVLNKLVDSLVDDFRCDNAAFKPARFRRAIYRDGVD